MSNNYYCPACGEIGSVVDDAEQALKKYVKENVEDFEVRMSVEYDRMAGNRIPLRVANYELYQEIEDCIAEWCEENNEDVSEFDVEDIIY